MDDVEQKLIEIFRAGLSLEMKDGDIRELRRMAHPQWDSMGHLNLILASEDVFQVSIPEDQGSTINSFAEMTELIQKLRQPR